MTELFDYVAASRGVDRATQGMISALERLAAARAYASGSQAEAPRFGRIAAAEAARRIAMAQDELRGAEAVLQKYLDEHTQRKAPQNVENIRPARR